MPRNVDEEMPRTTDPAAATDAISGVHSDVIQAHILTRLDGPALASLSCASSTLHALATEKSLWTNICHATWPSTAHPRMSRLIHSHRSFFTDVFPAVVLLDSDRHPLPENPSPVELISAVDIHYKNDLIFSKVQETETVSGWFRSSPFRIDLLEPKDAVPTPITHAGDVCSELRDELSLTWIIVDPASRRAANFSSCKPVSAQRHWFSGEVQVRFATVLAGWGGCGVSTELVQCGIVVTFGGCEGEGEKVHVREMSFQLEDMDGISLNGKESLGILQRALEMGKRMRAEEEVGVGYEEYVKMKRERKERKLRKEVRLDALCTALGLSIFAALSIFLYL